MSVNYLHGQGGDHPAGRRRPAVVKHLVRVTPRSTIRAKRRQTPRGRALEIELTVDNLTLIIVGDPQYARLAKALLSAREGEA